MGHSLIAYDISSDGIRRTVSRLLENWGTRLQQSVFVADISPGQRKELEQLARDKREKGDSLLVLPVCAACRARAGIAAYAPPQAHIFL